MKKLAVMLSIILILFTAGCKTGKDVIPDDPTNTVTIINQYKLCPKPEKPELYMLDQEQHIGGINNLNVIIDNSTDLILYIKELEATIECYECQTKEK